MARLICNQIIKNMDINENIEQNDDEEEDKLRNRNRNPQQQAEQPAHNPQYQEEHELIDGNPQYQEEQVEIDAIPQFRTEEVEIQPNPRMEEEQVSIDPLPRYEQVQVQLYFNQQNQQVQLEPAQQEAEEEQMQIESNSPEPNAELEAVAIPQNRDEPVEVVVVEPVEVVVVENNNNQNFNVQGRDFFQQIVNEHEPRLLDVPHQGQDFMLHEPQHEFRNHDMDDDFNPRQLHAAHGNHADVADVHHYEDEDTIDEAQYEFHFDPVQFFAPDHGLHDNYHALLGADHHEGMGDHHEGMGDNNQVNLAHHPPQMLQGLIQADAEEEAIDQVGIDRLFAEQHEVQLVPEQNAVQLLNVDIAGGFAEAEARLDMVGHDIDQVHADLRLQQDLQMQEDMRVERELFQGQNARVLVPDIINIIQMLENEDTDDDFPLARYRSHLRTADDDDNDESGSTLRLAPKSASSSSDDEQMKSSSSGVQPGKAQGTQEDGAEDGTRLEGLDWSLMPSNILVDIMFYLNDRDRLSMALVCKPWQNVLSCATLWRSRTLRFHGSTLRAKQEATRAKGFASAHGKSLRRLSLICEHPSYSVCKVFQRTVTEVLGTLLWQHTSLKRFSMRRLYTERYWRFDNLREKLISSVSRFLKRQHQLECVDLSDCFWSLVNGIKILDALASGAKGTRKLECLNIEDFFQSRLSVFRLGRFQNIMTKFKGLTTFYTNYSCMDEDVLLTITAPGRMRLLSIKVYRHEPHAHVISPHTWRTACRASPRCVVEIYVEGIGKFDELSPLLQRDMPVGTLQIWTGIHPMDQRWETDRLIRQIATNYGTSLMEAYLSLEPDIEVDGIDEALLEMLVKCKNLESLELQSSLEISTIDSIYQLQHDFKIGLLKLHININHLTQMDIDQLKAINYKWQEMVDERYLDFEIEANENILF